MKKHSLDNLAMIARLFKVIQQRANSLPAEDAQVVYLYFVSKMTTNDIRYICDLPPAKIHLILGDFLGDLFLNYRKLADLVSASMTSCCTYQNHQHERSFASWADLASTDMLMAYLSIINALTPEMADCPIKCAIETALRLGVPPCQSQIPMDNIANILGGGCQNRVAVSLQILGGHAFQIITHGNVALFGRRQRAIEPRYGSDDKSAHRRVIYLKFFNNLGGRAIVVQGFFKIGIAVGGKAEHPVFRTV